MANKYQLVPEEYYQILPVNDLGEIIGISVIKIDKLCILNEGEDQQQKLLFNNLINELATFSQTIQTSVELLYLTEPANGQFYKADINIYIVLRAYTNNSSIAYQSINMQCEVCCRILESMKIEYSIVKMDQLLEEFPFIKTQPTTALIKQERVIDTNNPYSAFYYTFDYFKSEHSPDEQDSLVQILSSYPDVMLSFQLIPRVLNPDEVDSITQVAGAMDYYAKGYQDNYYGTIRDHFAEQPAQVYGYYFNNLDLPTYYFNITATGSRAVSNMVLNRVYSVLNNKLGTSSQVPMTMIQMGNLDLEHNLMVSPWVICYSLVNRFRDTAFWSRRDAPNSLFEMPYIITSQEANTFFHLPYVFDNSLPGLTVKRTVAQTGKINEKLVQEDNIQIGFRDGRMDQKIGIPLNDFAKHLFISGIPGTGKTTFAQSLLYQLYQKGIPFLVIEPAKNEYRALIDVIPDLQVFTAGNSECIPLMINPFIPPKGVNLQSYKSSLIQAFSAAFDMESTLERLFTQTINSVYANHGWRDSSTKDSSVELFGLNEFIKEFKDQMVGKYDRETRERIQTAGVMRLNNLINKDFVLFDTNRTVPIEELLEKPTLIELNNVEDMEQKSLIIALLLINLFAYFNCLDQTETYGKLNHVTLLEEAHVLLNPSSNTNDSNTVAVDLINRILAEKRAAGFGLIIADQSPAKVSEDVIRLTGNKILFQTVEQKDRMVLAACTKMDQHMQDELTSLTVGKGFLFNSYTDIPEMIQTPDFRAAHDIRLTISNEECKSRDQYWSGKGRSNLPYDECSSCSKCSGHCSFKVRSEGRYLAQRIMSREFNKKKIDKATFLNVLKGLRKNLTKLIDPELTNEERNKAITCAEIKLLRDLYLEFGLGLSLRNRTNLLKKLNK